MEIKKIENQGDDEMSKIINFGAENKKIVMPENRLEITIKLLNSLISNGVVSKEEEEQIIRMINDKRSILGCPDKSLVEAYVAACDGQVGKGEVPEYIHISALGNFTHENKEMQELFELEKTVLWELFRNLDSKECIIKDENGNDIKKGHIELLFSTDEEQIRYKIRMLLNGEILRDMWLGEFFYVTSDYENYEVQILNGDCINIVPDIPIKDEDNQFHSEYMLKKIRMMKEYMTPEQNKEFEDMTINCLSDIIESNTGVKPEIEKEGDFIKVATEEPTIN